MARRRRVLVGKNQVILSFPWLRFSERDTNDGLCIGVGVWNSVSRTDIQPIRNKAWTHSDGSFLALCFIVVYTSSVLRFPPFFAFSPAYPLCLHFLFSSSICVDTHCFNLIAMSLGLTFLIYSDRSYCTLLVTAEVSPSCIMRFYD